MAASIKTLPSQEYLYTALDYDPLSGKLTWKKRPTTHFKNIQGANQWNGRFADKDAGCVAYVGKQRRTVIQIYINSTPYLASRVIWKMVTGNDPIAEIDHKDTNSLNNRWDNLREATSSQNGSNRAMQANNTTGARGVYLKRGRFQVIISVNGVMEHYGTYDTLNEAREVHATVAKTIKGEFFYPD